MVPAVLLAPDDPFVSALRLATTDETAAAIVRREVAFAVANGSVDGPDCVASVLLDRVIDYEGPFALAAERSGFDVPIWLSNEAASELSGLQAIVAGCGIDGPRGLVTPSVSTGASTKRAILDHDDWADGVRSLAAHFDRHGAGLLGRHSVFRWTGQLEPVSLPDPITLADLVAYERERAPLLHNLEAFVSGRPANNALLFGDRGAGKSATVKALAAAFADRGLKLIEVTRDRLDGFPDITAALHSRSARFLLLVDDLSFEEGEVSYATLKAMLEGGVAVQPANVLIYATSNRRHLVREMHADRWGETTTESRRGFGEVHISDTHQEKLSLSDRFGLRVLFAAPDQPTYLRICRELARRTGVDLAPEELDRRALLWCREHNARSCRTARQFVTSLQGPPAEGSAQPS